MAGDRARFTSIDGFGPIDPPPLYGSGLHSRSPTNQVLALLARTPWLGNTNVSTMRWMAAELLDYREGRLPARDPGSAADAAYRAAIDSLMGCDGAR